MEWIIDDISDVLAVDDVYRIFHLIPGDTLRVIRTFGRERG
jgi:hypothetical protein